MKSIFDIFSSKKKLKDLENNLEAITTPTEEIINNFKSNKLSMFGLIVFIITVLTVFIGSALTPINFNATEPELINVAPGRNMLNFPKKLNGNVKKIQSGVSFSAAIDNDNKFYIWGVDTKNVVSKVPDAVKNGKVVDFTVGSNYVLALLDNNEMVGWGDNIANQSQVPIELAPLTASGIKSLFSGLAYTGFITKSNKMFLWGDNLNNQIQKDPEWIISDIVKVSTGKYNIGYLFKDGSFTISGGGYISKNIPEEVKNIKIKDIAVSKNNVIVVSEDGNYFTWGNSGSKLLKNENPIIESKIEKVYTMYNAFILLDENGKLHAIGTDPYGELKLPKTDKKIVEVYSNYFTAYAIDEDGNIHAWGNKGFYLGSDNLGRDMLIRLLHGGKVSMTVGIVAVLISSLIGIAAGLISGFVGGWVDNLIQRIGEIISSLPFLPLVMTLSFAIGNKMSSYGKLYLVMILIGAISWVGLSRLIRGQILIEREKDFVLAARALGIKEFTIVMKHILPSVLNIAIVSITLGYAGNMLTESALSFLGFGVQPPIPSWGNMLTGSQESSVIQIYWWRWIFPTIGILIAVLSVNLIGDGLREAMDPKSNEK